MADRERIERDILEVIDLLSNTDELDVEIALLQGKIDLISDMVSQLVKENARTVQDQEEYARRYEELTQEYDEIKAKLDKASKERAYKHGKSIKMHACLETIKAREDYLQEWSDEVWVLMIDKATVNRDKTITFQFISGQEISL